MLDSTFNPPSVFQCVCPSVFLSEYKPTNGHTNRQLASLSSLSNHPSVCLYVLHVCYSHIRLSVYVWVCLSVSLSLSLSLSVFTLSVSSLSPLCRTMLRYFFPPDFRIPKDDVNGMTAEELVAFPLVSSAPGRHLGSQALISGRPPNHLTSPPVELVGD